MTPAVAAEHVTYRLGRSVLLDGVDLTVAPGEIVGIVGPNGAGKSTLLRLLAGDLVPSSGTTRILGAEASRTAPQELAHLRAYLDPLGVSVNPFSVRDTVAMGRYPHRRVMVDPDENEAIIDRAMDLTDVSHLAGRAVRSLSTGEHQRVGLARVIAQETPVLLLDEPTSALDIGHQENVMRVLRSLSCTGTAIVVVLHDVNLAAAHTDRIMLLDASREVATGPPGEVLTSQRLSAVYRQPMQVAPHPYRSCPLVLTIDPD